MSHAVDEIVKQIRADVEKKLDRTKRSIVKMAQDDFQKEGQRWIDNYYNEYESPLYNRTGNLRNNGCSSFKKIIGGVTYAGAQFNDSLGNYASVYGRNIDSIGTNGVKEKWKSGIEGIIMEDFIIGAHGAPSFPGTHIGEVVGDKMEKFEEMYFFKVDGIMKQNGLTRID